MSSKYLSTKVDQPTSAPSCTRRYLDPKQYTKIFALRALLITSLLSAAAICSSLSYVVLNEKETQLFESQYNSISDSALTGVVESFERMNLGLQAMASIYSNRHSDADDWPNVIWSGFYPSAFLIAELAQLENIWISPIVLPGQQLDEYKTFIGDYFANEPYIPKPFQYQPGSGVEMGTVWALNWTTYMMYRDETGITPLSPNRLLAPVAQGTFSETVGPESLGYNLHSDVRFAEALDAVMACTATYNYSFAHKFCGATSEAIGLPYPTPTNPSPVTTDLQALLSHPIFPVNDTGALTGFASGSMSWKSLLAKVVPTFVTGLDCVITTDAQQFTYSVTNGVPVFRGQGDLHDTQYTGYARSRKLLTQNVHSTSTTYTLSFYPRDEFVSQYTSNIPIWAVVLLIIAFAFCSTVFLAYDLLMHREFDKRQAILDTKRRFVRFISHEIRTPLNTVRLGLKLFDVELSKFCTEVKTAALKDLPALVNSAIASWRNLTDDILSNSESAVEVLDDLLNYDKIEVGALRLEFTVFNIIDLVRKTASFMLIQAQQKQINLTLDGVDNSSGKSGASGSVATTAFKEATGAGAGGSVNGGTGPATGSRRPSNNIPSSARSPSLHLLPPNALVAGDVTRLGQVLRNLISNALKFTPNEGHVGITVECISRATPDLEVSRRTRLANPTIFRKLTPIGGIRISVTDSGAGLTPEQLAEICTEGVQFNANELQAGQGSGLGLFISKGIVEQHGGKLTVTSEGLGKGVTFTVELPLYQPSDIECGGSVCSAGDGSQGATAAKRATADGADNRSAKAEKELAPRREPSLEATYRTSASNSAVKRLLIVDDSAFNRKMLGRLLTAKGYLCEQAQDGQESLDVYARLCDTGLAVDAILMDFEMPVMNGPTATKRLREMGCTCLIVGVTGNVLPADVSFFKQHGADAVFSKPLVLEEFEDLLQARSVRVSDHNANKGSSENNNDKNNLSNPQKINLSTKCQPHEASSHQAASSKIYPSSDNA